MSKGEDRFQVCHAGINRGRRPAFLFYIHLPAGKIAAIEKFNAQVEQVFLHDRSDDVLLSRLYSPANLGVVSGDNSRYYDINSLQIAKSAGAASASNIVIAYNESATCSTSNISITASS